MWNRSIGWDIALQCLEQFPFDILESRSRKARAFYLCCTLALLMPTVFREPLAEDSTPTVDLTCEGGSWFITVGLISAFHFGAG
jgi:hypothetical protein